MDTFSKQKFTIVDRFECAENLMYWMNLNHLVTNVSVNTRQSSIRVFNGPIESLLRNREISMIRQKSDKI